MLFPEDAVERAMKVRDVIVRAIAGQLSWTRAAEVLDMSPRTLRRWRWRMERFGNTGLMDMRRGRPSPRRVLPGEIRRVVELYRDRYQGFNCRHFHQVVRREHGVVLSYTLVKQILQAAGLVKKGRARGRHRRRREPRPCFGELLHIDGSSHEWLARVPGVRQTMIAIIDDATKQLLYAQLFAAESTLAVMRALRAVMQRYGIPGALYSDRASWAFNTVKAGGKVDPEQLTQVGRALAKLGVEHIPSYSPQARGRSERLNRTLQDRLVNELRVAGIGSLEEANRYLHAKFIPQYNATFSHPPRDPDPAFVPLQGFDLEQVLCHEEERVVGADNTVCFEGSILQIDKQPGRRTCAKRRVLVRRHLDGRFTVWLGPTCIGSYGPRRRREGRLEAAGPVDAVNGPGAHKHLGRRPNGRQRPQLPQALAAANL
jgi:transposase